MLSKRQAKFAQNVAKLIAYCDSIGKPCTLGEAYITPEQADIYAKQGIGIKNNRHTQRLAIDLNGFNSNYEYQGSKEFYQPLGDYWKSLHPANRWGGDFKKLVDSNHFEMIEID
jgi:hypothetical protein